MAKFYWVRDGHTSELSGVGQTAYAVIADYIERNKHKTADQLKLDLDIGKIRKEGQWSGDGHQPFTLTQFVYVPEHSTRGRIRYFNDTIALSNDEEISISTEWGITGKYEKKWNDFKKKMAEHGYTIEKEIIMRRFYWVRKEDGYCSPPKKAGPAAYAVIADYIERNKDKTVEQLKFDLDIWGTRVEGEWDNTGHHPFTLKQYLIDNPTTNGIRRHFAKTVFLSNDKEISISNEWGVEGASYPKWKNLLDKMAELGYTILPEGEDAPSEESSTSVSQEVSREVSLLQQFKQIILYGPPGTGKTYLAKKMLLELFHIDNKKDLDALQNSRWDIVQFHPSYNYEDFVRGVKVKTIDNKVVYETIDRIFGVMCKRAQKDPTPEKNKYVLIIDEINRANVSAVLGELIYALEYRGEPIRIPYKAEGDEDSKYTADDDKDSKLVIPKNLYIIGTMNTADRTIGKIDYAVRRRFAFVHCPPNENILKGDAYDAFSLVDDIFDKDDGYMSPDYDADDVRIGHSYFLPKPHENLADKIVYQVVPILREYVKDGVLLKKAEKDILDIENSFKNNVTTDDEFGEETTKQLIPFFYWKKDDKVVISHDKDDTEDVDVRRCCLISIEEIAERCSWDSCIDKNLGFVLASGISRDERVGKRRKGRIMKIKKGYIIFANILLDSNGNEGVIGMGEVLGKAVPINQFKVNETPILDYQFSDGQKYREKYPLAATDADDEEKCDWMVPVRWINTLPREEAEGKSRLPRVSLRVSLSKLNIIKQKFEGVK